MFNVMLAGWSCRVFSFFATMVVVSFGFFTGACVAGTVNGAYQKPGAPVVISEVEGNQMTAAQSSHLQLTFKVSTMSLAEADSLKITVLPSESLGLFGSFSKVFSKEDLSESPRQRLPVALFPQQAGDFYLSVEMSMGFAGLEQMRSQQVKISVFESAIEKEDAARAVQVSQEKPNLLDGNSSSIVYEKPLPEGVISSKIHISPADEVLK